MANYFERFDAAPAAAPGTANYFSKFDEPKDGPSTLLDKVIPHEHLNAAEVGTRNAIAGTAGFVGDMTDMLGKGMGKVTNYLERKAGLPESPEPDRQQTFMKFLPTHKDMMEYLDEKYGPTEPVTGNARYTKNIFEFGLGAAGGGPGRQVIKRAADVIIPAVTSEAAGQAAEGTGYEGAARFAAALAGGGASQVLTRPNTAERVIARQLPPGVTPAHFDQAQALMDHARSIGIDLPVSEALSQVTGRPVLTNLTRHLEGSHQTEGRMGEFYAERPQQVESAARAQFDNIAPVNHAPSTIGPAIGEAAVQTAEGVRSAINRATRPAYDAAGQSLVPGPVHSAMRTDPLFVEALDEVRNNAAKNANIRGHSDRSVLVYDAVKKELKERAQNAAHPMNPNASQAVAATTGGLADTVRGVAIASDRQATNGPSSYEAALANQTRLRAQYLNPLLQGPLKGMSGETTTKNAIEALFPAKPLANSEHEIGDAVTMLSHRNPRAAESLVRAHIEGTFNAAAKDLQSGANQAGGAKFRAALVGNAQQRLNLQAAVDALPGGGGRWAGFNRFLDVMEATGTRQNVGSRTAYNAEFAKEASKGGLAADAIKTAGAPYKVLEKFNEHYERWKYGKDLNQLVNILTDPRAGQLLRNLSSTTNRGQRQVLALKLLTYANGSVKTTPPPVSKSSD